MFRKVCIVLSCIAFVYACSSTKRMPAKLTDSKWKSKTIPEYEQQPHGDPQAGLNFLIYGNYLGRGIPYEFLKKKLPDTPDTILNREGLNSNAPLGLTVFEAANGVVVGNGNCFSCHAGKLNGEVVLGLGNSFSDYKKNFSWQGKLLNAGMKRKYKTDSKEYQAFQPFGNIFKDMAPYIEANQRGVNPAAILAEACARHRDPVTLEYVSEPNYEMYDYVITSDVPPLWNVKKRNSLYYTAIGRGDFTKLLFQASVLGIKDTTEARYAVDNFDDVVAWLKSITPPAYPEKIDGQLADKGKPLFEENCSGCHGTYGENESYPNKIYSLDVVGTDPLYANYAMQAPFVEWFNKSWFATSEPKAWLEPSAGYVAPPLDGIWATAPYLHNGSVPTLYALLNSEKRPKYWSRSGDSRDFDFNNVGWYYEPKKKGKWSYDTTLPGYGNEGHTYGDKLSEEQRLAVIEYLKTL